LSTQSSSSKKLLTIVIGLWVGVCLGVALIGVLVLTGVIPLLEDSTKQGAPPLAAEESGVPAPDFELPDLDDNLTRLSDYEGKVVVLNFWATWCGPCVREMPMFQEFQDRYPDMVMLGVDEEESPETVGEFLQAMSITYIILLDEKAELARELRVNYLPTTFFVDQQGEIRFRHYGILTEEQFTYYLTELGVIEE
jgi:cytochrome c biogenesis protein CcmG/thiol:disulfide interchange protein DsbE